MIELQEDNLEKVLRENENVVVQFGATWCGGCRIVKPKVKKLSESRDDITFVYVDAESLPNSRKLANISNLPTFAAYKNGELVSQTTGTKVENVEELANEIANH